MTKIVLFGAALMMSVASLSGAQAFVGAPGLSGIEALPGLTPAAMCGRSCEYGGRYIPGPPEVCYERGLRYCGSSRDRGPTIQAPGVSIELGRSGPTVRRGVNCEELRYACINKDRLGEQGEGNCRRYRQLCR
jgi:hypothetical protein